MDPNIYQKEVKIQIFPSIGKFIDEIANIKSHIIKSTKQRQNYFKQLQTISRLQQLLITWIVIKLVNMVAENQQQKMICFIIQIIEIIRQVRGMCKEQEKLNIKIITKIEKYKENIQGGIKIEKQSSDQLIIVWQRYYKNCILYADIFYCGTQRLLGFQGESYNQDCSVAKMMDQIEEESKFQQSNIYGPN
ncbi:hypothetical protein pb186bvf_000393 [Paramecium bursaria]